MTTMMSIAILECLLLSAFIFYHWRTVTRLTAQRDKYLTALNQIADRVKVQKSIDIEDTLEQEAVGISDRLRLISDYIRRNPGSSYSAVALAVDRLIAKREHDRLQTEANGGH